VPEGDYTLPLGKAEVMRRGTDVTVVGWGGQLRVLEKVGVALWVEGWCV
jgi:2-oxoisovalerate dehydrogenase E1 component beta subunit